MLRLTLLGCILGTVLAVHPPFNVIFQWNYISYNWPLSRINIDEEYIAENNAIAGIKLWKNKLYLTVPRWKNGVPVTLAVTSATPRNGDNSPNLDPYPNWDMQELGNCSALQFVQSMEIDPLGRMWVLDTGRTETMTLNPATKCPPRLVILDLENDGRVLRSYEFPNEVAPRKSVHLNDIVLDHEDGGMAFITDSGRDDPGIIVYSLKDNKSWKVRHDSMRAQEDAVGFTVGGITISTPIPVDGIALSPPGPKRWLYYSPLSSLHLYAIPVSVIKNTSVKNIDNDVVDLGLKQSQTDGMVMTNQGSLYLGLLNDDSVAMLKKSGKDLPEKMISANDTRLLYRDHSVMQWLDTFAIDERGKLWCVTNRLQNFMANRVDKLQPNYRVLRSSTTANNYQYFENGIAPELPEISETTAAASRITLPVSNCLIIALVFFAH